MRISRSTAGTAFVGGAMILTLTALAYPTMLGVQTTSTKADRVVANTNYGPLTEADRDFVVKVRAAGLWEHPLGLLAMERGTTPEMKEAGEHLVVGHGGWTPAAARSPWSSASRCRTRRHRSSRASWRPSRRRAARSSTPRR